MTEESNNTFGFKYWILLKMCYKIHLIYAGIEELLGIQLLFQHEPLKLAQGITDSTLKQQVG